jgi:hypothetical protein
MIRQNYKMLRLTVIMASISMIMAGCSFPTPQKTTANSSPIDASKVDGAKTDLFSLFSKEALAKPSAVVDCTLSTGEATR